MAASERREGEPRQQLYTPELLLACQRLPKVELHAHLNGSVRPETIRAIVEERTRAGEVVPITPEQMDFITDLSSRSLADCFRLFDVIHAATTTHAAVSRIAAEVVADFAADRVVYLELRTTPKARPEYGMTKASYIEAVLDGIDAALRQLAEQPQEQPQQRQLVPASPPPPQTAHGPTTSAPDHDTGGGASSCGPSQPRGMPLNAPASPSRSMLVQASAGLGVSPPSPSHGSLLQPHHAGSGCRPNAAAASEGQHGGGVDGGRGEGVGPEEREAGRGASAPGTGTGAGAGTGAGEGEGALGGREAGTGSGSGDGAGSGCGITVKLILSIDRREDEAAAMETVDLAVRYRPRGVVGVDLSGNPRVGSWGQWEGALAAARLRGLAMTLHAGEVWAPGETAAMLALRPERLGHCCCLDERLGGELKSAAIPLELCLTSNVLTQSVPSYPEHHFAELYAAGHPVVLCTDDSGVFDTTLSREYAIAAAAFNLSIPDIQALALKSVDYTFASEQEKMVLRERMRREMGLDAA